MITFALVMCIVFVAFVVVRIIESRFDGGLPDVSSIPPPPRVHAKDFISPDLAKCVEEKAFAHFLLRYKLNLKHKETQNDTQNDTMTIIHQQWYKERRALIIDTENLSMVQVSVPDADSDDNRIEGKADALIYSLWVDEFARRRGVGRKLLEMAEREARRMGCKTVCLEWNWREAPEWVRRWYNRMGYSGQREPNNVWLLTKKL